MVLLRKVQWRTQNIFMGDFIQWRLVLFVFGVRCVCDIII